jgi:hypothetical protein
VAGAGGLALCGVGLWWSSTQFFRSYLLAYLFWIGMPLGCLAVLMLHHLVGGAWGAIIRRVLEAGTRTLPLMGLLFTPLLFGLHDLYRWANPDILATDVLLQRKAPYLNAPWFVARAAVYFAVWTTLSYWLNRWSRAQDQAEADPYERRMRLLSGPGLVLYVLTMTFAAVDWVMSLEPDWFSTLYGILVIVGHILATFALVIVIAARLADAPPVAAVISAAHFHDLGNLLLAFVLLWAYIAFSQFLIIWAGNLPEEITWYVHRTQGGWQWVGGTLMLFAFALPFLLLLSRQVKQTGDLLALVAAAILVMHWVDLWWFVVPAFQPTGVYVHWLDLATLVGIGGIWAAVFIWQLKKQALLPRYDPGLEATIPHG